MFQKYYKLFLDGHKDKIHMACHSHHFWPDIAREAQLEYFDIAAKKSDDKWGFFFETIIPENQSIIAKHLNFSRPQDIAFAPNTHELIVKIISHFFRQERIKILTTKSEFHSLTRQLKSFATWEKFEITWLDNESENFTILLEDHLKSHSYDLIFISHVFYNSGNVLTESSIKTIISHKKNALFILDGYHSYCALPFDLSNYENDLYYLAGGYKYAQAGEGMCFITLPKTCSLRPLITGWMAVFGNLSGEVKQNEIPYSNDGFKLWGSTLDMTAFLRFNRIWNFFKQEQITIKSIHEYVQALQVDFLKENPLLSKFLNQDIKDQGHFLTVELKSKEKAEFLYKSLLKKGILTDFRGTRLRFGMSPYLNKTEIEHVKSELNIDFY